jgi:molybdopterin/thiamine biosynthesis adenylyltransferase
MATTLVVLEKDWRAIRQELLQDDENERAAFCIAEKSNVGMDRIYIRSVRTIVDNEYQIQTPMFNSLRPEAQVDLYNWFRKREETGFMEIHSHPFADVADFSMVDDDRYPGFRDDILRRKNDAFVLRMVIGRKDDGFTCLLTDQKSGEEIPVSRVVVIGKEQLRIIQPRRSAYYASTLSPDATSVCADPRLTRNVAWLGEARQQQISNIRVGCLGAGGLMDPFTLAAARAGFKHFCLVDFDKVEDVNYNRLLGLSSTDLGKFKVDVLERELRRYDPDLDILTLKGRIQDEDVQRALQSVDIIVSGVDNDEARLVLQLFAARHMIPVLDMGSGIFLNSAHTRIERKGGQIRAFIPGHACLVCQGLDLDKIHSTTWLEAKTRAGYIMDTNESPGSVITFNMSLAGMALSMLMDYVTGINRIPQQLGYDELGYQMRHRAFASKQNCPICGENGIVGAGMEKDVPDGNVPELPDAFEALEVGETQEKG